MAGRHQVLGDSRHFLGGRGGSGRVQGKATRGLRPPFPRAAWKPSGAPLSVTVKRSSRQDTRGPALASNAVGTRLS